MKKLYKSRTDNKIDGVCAGIANYIGIDPTIVRVLWLLATLFTAFSGVIFYFIAAIVLPREPEDIYTNYEEVE